MLVLLKNHVFQITMSILTLLPHFSTSKMGTTLNISAYSMKGVTMKWFDFDEILKCSGGKRLLKSYVDNKLKTIKKIELFLHFFSPNISLFLLSLYRNFLEWTGFTAYLFWEAAAKRDFYWVLPPYSHISVQYQYQGRILYCLRLISLYTAVLLF